MKRKKKRTLYECAHARVKGNSIYCSKGHTLSIQPGSKTLDISLLAAGQLLACKACKDCPDFEYIGPWIPPDERGWLGKRERG